jgi:hypothetical protein
MQVTQIHNSSKNPPECRYWTNNQILKKTEVPVLIAENQIQLITKYTQALHK